MEFREVLRARSFTRDELESFRVRKLRAVVRHAYENVPYYRSLFDSAGLSPGDIRGVEDLKKIPVTTKEALRGAGLERTTSVGADLSTCIKRPTSGSTGKPFTAYLSRSDFVLAGLYARGRL
jgi:phenylacetate-CoA ligase